MTNSLRELLKGCVDYAGIYPPASLDLETALRNYADYRQSAESWMLGRFVCPVSRLEEFATHVDLLIAAGDCTLSAIGAASRTLNDNQFCADLETMAAFQATHAQFVFGSIEFKLPEFSESESNALAPFFDAACEAADDLNTNGGDFKMFAEVPSSCVEVVADQIMPSHREKIGLKIRTGGEGVEISESQLASFIAICTSRKVFFKATAGLHHPLSHRALGHWECGFLNLFVAAVLARRHSLDAEQISQILATEIIESITVEPDRIRWNEYAMNVAEINESRRDGLKSFGSCSFDEPLTGLRQLGLV